MKKRKSLIVAILVLAFVLLSGACSGGLESPTGLFVDDNNTLIWNIVDEARSYAVEIKFVESGETKEETVRRNNYSLSGYAEGDYELRVKAIGGRQNSLTSNWSEVLLFHKDYETGLVYSLINGGNEYEITRVGNAAGEVVIEDIYRGKPVTRIAGAAFRGNSKVKRIVVGNNVTEVGNGAFINCPNLVSVVLPEGLLSLGVAAFQQCGSLREINIPASITEIASYMFAYCRSLSRIELHDEITKIDDYAFCNCDSLEEIKIPDAVTKIGIYAFDANTSLSSVKIGSGIQMINTCAFSRCSALKELELPAEASLVIGASAFANCTSLESVVLPEGTTSINNYAFADSTELSEISIPDSVTSVGSRLIVGTKLYNEQLAGDGFIYADKWLVAISDELQESITVIEEDTLKPDTFGLASNAFRECPVLEEVALPRAVKYIGYASFAMNPVLYRFTTSDNSLIEVGDYAFAFCDQLINVQFGTGLEVIGSYAFRECTLLDNNQFNVERLVPATVKRIGTWAFKDTALWGKPEDGVIYAGNWVVGYDESSKPSEVELKREQADVAGIADYAFFMNDMLESVVGLNKVQNIGRGAFAFCVNLGSVNLNRNLRVIKEYTFFYCEKLMMVDFPARLTEIERYAFAYCSNLWNVDLSETQVQKIAYRAFSECAKGSAVLTLPDTLETIESYAFYSSGFNRTLEIPGSVKSIGHRAFALNNFQSIVIKEGVETIGSYAFKGCARVTSVVLPESMQTIGAYAFYGCRRLTDIDFGGTQTIGTYAFGWNTSLTRVNIPQSVVSIGDFAFRDCTSLTSVVLQGSLEYVGVHSFYGCSKMTAFVVGSLEMGDKWGRWNTAFRPVVWNCTLSEDGTYVESIVTGELTNVFEGMLVGEPVRDGYKFVGWATSPDGEVEYTAQDIMYLEPDMTLYAVWVELVDDRPAKPDMPTEEPEEDLLNIPELSNPPTVESIESLPAELRDIALEFFSQLR